MISSPVRSGAEELADEVTVGTVNLNAIEASLLAARSGIRKGLDECRHLSIFQLASSARIRVACFIRARRNRLHPSQALWAAHATVEYLRQRKRTMSLNPGSHPPQTRQLVVSPNAHLAVPTLALAYHMRSSRGDDSEAAFGAPAQPLDFGIGK